MRMRLEGRYRIRVTPLCTNINGTLHRTCGRRVHFNHHVSGYVPPSQSDLLGFDPVFGEFASHLLGCFGFRPKGWLNPKIEIFFFAPLPLFCIGIGSDGFIPSLGTKVTYVE